MQTRRDRPHLEGRLHHPRRLPRRFHHAGLQGRARLRTCCWTGASATAINARQDAWRASSASRSPTASPVPAFSASLAYYDSYRRERLPANLIQAQRDFFGAHTYERIDKPGIFHTEWSRPATRHPGRST
jgi:6-phosphogluconate dehydrogenase